MSKSPEEYITNEGFLDHRYYPCATRAAVDNIRWSHHDNIAVVDDPSEADNQEVSSIKKEIIEENGVKTITLYREEAKELRRSETDSGRKLISTSKEYVGEINGVKGIIEDVTNYGFQGDDGIHRVQVTTMRDTSDTVRYERIDLVSGDTVWSAENSTDDMAEYGFKLVEGSQPMSYQEQIRTYETAAYIPDAELPEDSFGNPYFES